MSYRIRSVSAWSGLALVMAALVAGGCTTERTTVGGFPHGQTTVVSNPGPAPASTGQPPPANNFHGDPIGNDPCDIRLQDIAGQLLWYYAVHQRLPSQLEELASVTNFDQVPDYTCPVTHQPYGYAPAGLELRGDPRRLIVFDAAPHGGKRRVILFASAKGRQPPTMDAIELPERAFAAYAPPTGRPARPLPAPATTPAVR